MNADVALVVEIQSLDERIAALEKEIGALPRHIARIEKALDTHLRQLEANKAALLANQKDRKQKDVDIQTHQQKISKLRDQMLGAKNNEQYRAFQKEIEYLEKQIRVAEDRILELMSESEPLDANVKQAEAALKEEQKQVGAEQKEARERTALDKAELDSANAKRAELLGRLPRPIVNAYDRIRKKWHGSVVAEVVGGRCTACQISLRPQFVQDLRKGNEIMHCESCSRFVYYDPPESFSAVDMTA